MLLLDLCVYPGRWLVLLSALVLKHPSIVYGFRFVSLLLGRLAFTGSVFIRAIFSLVVTGQYVAYRISMARRFFGG